jgi:hypothetical protein
VSFFPSPNAGGEGEEEMNKTKQPGYFVLAKIKKGLKKTQIVFDSDVIRS